MNLLGVHALVFSGSWTKKDRERAVGGAAKLGYDLIEIPLLDPSGVDAKATVKLLEQNKIKAVTSLGLNFKADISSADATVAKRGEALLNRALAVTRDLGATYMGGVIYSALGKYPAPATAKGRRNCIAALRRLAKTAKQSGITLGLEPVNRYESNLINTGGQAVEIIEATGADNIFVHLDTYHMNIEEGDLAGCVERCGKHVGYFHVGESHRGYLGTGTIDFPLIFRALARIGYAGPITFESFSSAVVDRHLSSALAVWRNLWTDSDDLAGTAKRFIEKEWDAAQQGVRP
jgi:D-psicose/D-tagatose/L-ribulose 3-epimerase